MSAPLSAQTVLSLLSRTMIPKKVRPPLLFGGLSKKGRSLSFSTDRGPSSSHPSSSLCRPEIQEGIYGLLVIILTFPSATPFPFLSGPSILVYVFSPRHYVGEFFSPPSLNPPFSLLPRFPFSHPLWRILRTFRSTPSPFAASEQVSQP